MNANPTTQLTRDLVGEPGQRASGLHASPVPVAPVAVTAPAPFARLAFLAGVGVAILGGFILACWFLGWPHLTTVVADSPPASPRAGLMLLLLGVVFCRFDRWFTSRPARVAAALALIVAFSLAALRLLEIFTPATTSWEAHLLAGEAPASAIHLSHFAALWMVLLSWAGLELLWRPTGWGARIAGLTAVAVALVNFVTVLRYLHGAPNLFGDLIRPTSFLGAVGALALALGLILWAGPARLPLRWVVGPGISAKLLRTFLPITFLALLAGELAGGLFFGYSTWNPAIQMILAILLMGWAVIQSAHMVSADLEQAWAARADAEAALRASRDQLELEVVERTVELSRTVGDLEAEITRRVEMEDNLRTSEEQFRTLFEAAPIAVAMHDAAGRYLDVNRAYCEMLGYERAELLTLSVRRVTHPADVAQGRTYFAEMVAGHRNQYTRLKRYGTKDGRTVHALSAASAVRHRDGRLRYIISMVLDVSKRQRLQDEVIEIGNRERRRIGYELHDGLGQHLSGLALKAKCLESALSKKFPARAAEARELVHLINDAIGQTRSLARGLEPVEVEMGGLAAALQHLVNESERVFGVRCVLRCDTPDLPVNKVNARHLFRIAQEAMNNALKHARATQLQIEIAAGPGFVRLAVLDDGCGFAPDRGPSQGLGLQTMQYRADSIGATLHIRPREKGGSTVECILPVPLTAATPTSA